MNIRSDLAWTLSLLQQVVPLLALVVLTLNASAQAKCATTTTIDTSTTPPTAWIDCAENGCTSGCFSFMEMTPYGLGTTCSCSSVTPPRCCHVILTPVSGGQWVVTATGNCGVVLGCQNGDECTIYTLIEEDRFITNAKCLGST